MRVSFDLWLSCRAEHFEELGRADVPGSFLLPQQSGFQSIVSWLCCYTQSPVVSFDYNIQLWHAKDISRLLKDGDDLSTYESRLDDCDDLDVPAEVILPRTPLTVPRYRKANMSLGDSRSLGRRAALVTTAATTTTTAAAEITVTGLPRSKSFTGSFGNVAAGHRRTMSSGNVNGNPEVAPWTPVLGQGFRSNNRQSLGLPTSMKLNKNPRPARACIMFEALSRGLREFIQVTVADIRELKNRVDSVSESCQQHLKLSERYVKRLEYQLTKVEELKEQYELQMRIRDGVRTMAHAFILSPGKEKETALTNVRSGIKECTETLCAIEAHLQQMMGTLQLQMKGVQGFARLCAGDDFEICIKHGQQKWKTRGRVLKNNQQVWENPKVIFKSLMGEVLHIKAAEIKGFTKTTLLGNKYCETKELFCPHPQVMTVSLNTSGSLKLSILITWNPLHGIRDINLQTVNKVPVAGLGTRINTASQLDINGSIGSCSVMSSLADSHLDESCEHMLTLDAETRSSSSSSSGHSTTSTSSWSAMHTQSPVDHVTVTVNPEVNHRVIRSRSAGTMTTVDCAVVVIENNETKTRLVEAEHSDNNNSRNGAKMVHVNRRSAIGLPEVDVDRNWGLRLPVKSQSLEAINEAAAPAKGVVTVHLHVDRAQSPVKVEDAGHGSLRRVWMDRTPLLDVVRTISSCLEDIQGHYPELQSLEQQVIELEQIVQDAGIGHCGETYPSDINLAVESALECFNFLNTEVDGDDLEYAHTRIMEGSKIIDRDLTAKTSDSGIGSLARRLRRTDSSSPDGERTAMSPATGCEQLDAALCVHLSYCHRLLENLGSFGPLRHRETQAIANLKHQSRILERLLQLAKEDKKSISGLAELKRNPQLQELWQTCADKSSKCLVVNVQSILPRLATRCKLLIQEKFPTGTTDIAAKVADNVITAMLDLTTYDQNCLLTVFQFRLYFKAQRHNGIEQHIRQLAEEVSLCKLLRSSNVPVITRTLVNMAKNPPNTKTLTVVSTLLLSENQVVVEAADNYLKSLTSNVTLRKKVTEILCEALELEDPGLRQGACTALGRLQATDCIDLLSYLCHTDGSVAVQSAAKEALLSFGSEGRQVVEQTQLTKLGFQGISINY